MPCSMGLSGASVRVAVLESGCDGTHPTVEGDLERRLGRRYTGDDDGYPTDSSDSDRYGRLCASLIVARIWPR